MQKLDLKHWAGFTQAGGNLSSHTEIDQIEIDSRRIHSKQSLFIALPGKTTDGHHHVEAAASLGARYAIVEKNWNLSFHHPYMQLLRVDNPIRAFQEITALHRQRLPTTVVGITGSFGKTLLKDLLHKLLATHRQVFASPESYNSQIGVPLSLLQIKPEDEIALIEAGISLPGEMDNLVQMIQPNCSILTNVGKAHLETLGSLEVTQQEKCKLLQSKSNSLWKILPKEVNPQLNSSANTYFWNSPNPLLPHASFLSSTDQRKLYSICFPNGAVFKENLQVDNPYLLDLINIAIKAAWLFKVPQESIIKVLQTYHFEPLQTEIWKSPTDITFINDGYCSDPNSLEKGLAQLNTKHGKTFFLFGGLRETRLENSNLHIAKSLSRKKIDHLLLYGKQNLELVNFIKELSPTTHISICQDFEDAIHNLKKMLKPHDAVLIKGPQKERLDLILHHFNDSVCNNQCVVNFRCIKNNLDMLKKRQPSTRLMIMVKASAYGTDDLRMAQFLSHYGIDILGVSYVEEGVALRRSGFNQSIFAINIAVYEASKVVEYNLEAGVSSQASIKALALEASKHSKKLKVHLHVDTGMNRFGCRTSEALELAKLIHDSPSLEFEGIMTHFATADNPQDDEFTFSQIAKFDAVISELEGHGIYPRWRHAANSSALIRFNLPQYNMARVGLALYGLYTSEACQESLKLNLALNLTSRVVGINHCQKGETISYGRHYTVERNEQKIAVLPIGYFDGLHRNYSGQGHVMIRGCKVPMVGKICMDFMMVDVTDIPGVQEGDSALIFGYDECGNYLSPETLAGQGNSIVHELITCLGPRIERIYINDL